MQIIGVNAVFQSFLRKGSEIALIFLTLIAITNTEETRPGKVAFIFDGGSIVYSYQDTETRSSVEVKLVHPSGERDPFSDEPELATLNSGQSMMYAIQLTENGDRANARNLSEERVRIWARNRVLQLTEKDCSRSEQSFLSLVLYLSGSNQPVKVWGSEAVRNLEEGNWIYLLGAPNAGVDSSRKQLDRAQDEQPHAGSNRENQGKQE